MKKNRTHRKHPIVQILYSTAPIEERNLSNIIDSFAFAQIKWEVAKTRNFLKYKPIYMYVNVVFQ